LEGHGEPGDILEANHLILDGFESSHEGSIEDAATIVGRVKIGKGTVVFGKSVIRGPSIIGENCKIGPSAYVGPYTAIGDRCQITMAEVDDSIVMDDAVIDVEMKLVWRLISWEGRELTS
jgi:NDP-sugar pyrophosphorylase family protein